MLRFVFGLLLALATCVRADDLVLFNAFGDAPLAGVLAEFESQSGIAVREVIQPDADLNAWLGGYAALQRPPEVVLLPQDFVFQHIDLAFSDVDPRWVRSRVAAETWDLMRVNDRLPGAPIGIGDHLMLLYNRELVTQPAQSFGELIEQKAAFAEMGLDTIGWKYDEMYWFVPFLAAFGGWPVMNGRPSLDTAAMTAALVAYQRVGHALLNPACDIDCSLERFAAGRLPYLIIGDWELRSLRSALGSDLRLAPLPSVDGHPLQSMYSLHVLAFPGDSLNGPKREQLLALLTFLQGPTVQFWLWKKHALLPVDVTARDHVLQSMGDHRQSSAYLMRKARPMPVGETLSATWPAMHAGFIEFESGRLSAAQAATLMQERAEAELAARLEGAPPD
jgi:arabinogalactan oligomer/maltooligosaccharide transport system substrate-binding protein